MRKTYFLFSLIILVIYSFGQVPIQFDLRNVDGDNYVTSVKSQTSGTCWTHGTLAALEGNLLMNGNWADSLNYEEPNFAEYHLDWWNGFNSYFNRDLDTSFNNGEGLEVHLGGDYRVSSAYMSRGEGFVYCEEANDETEKDDVWFEVAPDLYDSSFQFYYSRDVEWYIVGEDLDNIDFVKQKIMTEGVMATCMCYNNAFINNDFEHYQPSTNSSDPNHSVAIIGWDDDKQTQAPEPGAWLVKNSWGSSWGNDGYFWISYYDKHAGQHPEMGAISFINTEPFQYDNVYYHDYHGWRDTKEDITEVFNAFVSDGLETIHSVSFFSAVHDVDFTVKIFGSFDGEVLSIELSNLSGHIDYSGFHTVDLEETVNLGEGEEFYVYLYLSDGGQPYDRTSLVPVLLGSSVKTEVPSTANPEESYYMSGKGWEDFYYYDDPSEYLNTGNFCVKALTKNYDPVTIINKVDYQNNISIRNYPNPFVNSTTIEYAISAVSNVEIIVSGITGKRLQVFEFGEKLAGNYHFSWNGNLLDGTIAESGIYFVQLSINKRITHSFKMIKLK